LILRTLHEIAVRAARRFPVVVVTGPRQSGKTTLCQMAFPGKPYASLEAPDVREFALSDPRRFLAQFPRGAILDEVQRAPSLLSYIQGIVDERRRSGLFVLTGSQHFGLLEAVTQSLAGRSAILHLYPFSLEELRRARRVPRDLSTALFRGGYPRIHDRRLEPSEWLAGYVASYVERDVRQVLQVSDLLAFQTFVRMCAGRTGQLLNLSALGSDCGVTHNTARAWLSVLETGFLSMRLPLLHRNLGKRLVKAPKIHLLDSGLACYLLGIRSPTDLEHHPLRGAIFESWVVSEVLKWRQHRGLPADLAFFRDRKGAEVDLVVETARPIAVEAKSGGTVKPEFFGALADFGEAMSARAGTEVRRVVVHGGAATQERTAGTALSWSAVDRFDWSGAKPPTRSRRTASR
jgi:predicted AAA+ superfamily ATPase